ncbi:MAG: CRISPR-associated endonuclease Cas2 [Acidimicrobiales bacterium]
MSRRRFLVTYDISDPKRWREVYDVVRSHGDRLQYSVYLCDLDGMEKIAMMTALRGVIDHHRDRVAIIDLGEPNSARGGMIEFMGPSRPLPAQGPQIV